MRRGTAPVCEAVRQSLAGGRRTFAESLGKPPFGTISWQQTDDSASLPDDLQGSDEARFDFDNDGTPDRVFTHYFETRYMQGTVVLAQLGSRATDRWFLPCQLDAKAIRLEDCPPFSQANDDAGFSIQGATPREKPFFRGRYIDLTPFRFADTTYVAVESHSEDTSRYVGVIKPVRGKKSNQPASSVPVAKATRPIQSPAADLSIHGYVVRLIKREGRVPAITPMLWFDTQAEGAAQFYTSVFKNSKIR